MNDILYVKGEDAIAYPDSTPPTAVVTEQTHAIVVTEDNTAALSVVEPQIVTFSDPQVSVVVTNNDRVQALSNNDPEYLTYPTESVSVVATLAQAPVPPAAVTPSNVVTFTNKTLTDYSNTIHADQVHSRVKATEDIPAGAPVRYVGYNSGENAVEVALADNTVAPAIGISEEALLTGEFGLVTTHGTLEKVDTSGYQEGAILYPDDLGGLTDVPPAIGFQQPIAFVLRSQSNNGAILISAGYPKQNADDIRGISAFMQTLLDDETAEAARATLGIDDPTGTGQVYTATVLAGNVSEIDSVPVASIRSVKWMLTVTEPASGNVRVGEIMATHIKGDASHIHYGVFGSQLSYTIQVEADVLSLSLRVHNTDNDTLRFDATRVGLTPV